jgi:hypothetical protein
VCDDENTPCASTPPTIHSTVASYSAAHNVTQGPDSFWHRMPWLQASVCTATVLSARMLETSCPLSKSCIVRYMWLLLLFLAV